ncbi:MAG: glycosyltransferase, partial [Desulfobulbaceae bacterium]|nr:glycosyltransferase [Desulfobulbaceae bacterium]
LPQNCPLLICGSTHKGEEKILLIAFCAIKTKIPDFHLLIAPRDISRAGEIELLARGYNLSSSRRSLASEESTDILILDTLGELASCYRLADIAFIGGSLVPAGGHNPLEAATCGRPVLFGPFMDDFTEISRDLVAAGGAVVVATVDELVEQILSLLNSPQRAAVMGAAAKNLVQKNQGVVQCHLDVIEQLLNSPASPGNG